jgi:hydrogenase large subunit
MSTFTIIDPITRIEGHMKVNVTIEAHRGVQQVVDVQVAGNLFRGFENLLIGREPTDAQHITQRICGVCPIPHAMAAVMTLDSVSKTTIPANGLLLRNLVMGANFVESHILHFYLLSALDYIDGPAQRPWLSTWSIDRRFNASQTSTLIGHYLKAIEMKRKGQEAAAVFGGKQPHSPAFVPGGFTHVPTQDQITLFADYANELIDFIDNIYIPDAEALASVYEDYTEIGAGYGNLLSFGCFDEDPAGRKKLFSPGYVMKAARRKSALEASKITEQVKYGWYKDSTSKLKPENGKTEPLFPKGDAYSWLKSPRYQNAPMEVGPLARMWMTGDYTEGVSVMDRQLARAYETQKIAVAMKRWLGQVRVGDPVFKKTAIPESATGSGLTEAPRGALGHWVKIAKGKIAGYQVITPTCWNCSPRDDKKMLGPMEKAIMGTVVQDPDKPVEVLRVVHSFDPCLDCAVHVMRAK